MRKKAFLNGNVGNFFVMKWLSSEAKDLSCGFYERHAVPNEVGEGYRAEADLQGAIERRGRKRWRQRCLINGGEVPKQRSATEWLHSRSPTALPSAE